MAITYTWTIPTLEHEIADGGVYVAHWRCSGVDGDGNSASSYGTCGFTYDASSADFTAYADLTEQVRLMRLQAQPLPQEHLGRLNLT